ncbi:MAG: 5'-nucleotidase C-terminal domain-containing protein [Congregibacter sp.]
MREATNAEIALMPSSALRRDLPVGDIRRVDLLDAFPFENHNAIVTARGNVLQQILEQGFSLERGLLQVTGIVLSYDPTASKGSRVQTVCVGDQPLNPGQLYTIATLEILAQGGDAYRQFLEAEQTQVLQERFSDTLEKAFSGRESVDAQRAKGSSSLTGDTGVH